MSEAEIMNNREAYINDPKAFLMLILPSIASLTYLSANISSYCVANPRRATARRGFAPCLTKCYLEIYCELCNRGEYNCGCEPYQFDEIPEAIKTLKEWISWQEQDRKVTLSKEITLIPFGHHGGGDLYCFLYSKNDNEPMVVLYYHDMYGDPEIVRRDLISDSLVFSLLKYAKTISQKWHFRFCNIAKRYDTLLKERRSRYRKLLYRLLTMILACSHIL